MKLDKKLGMVMIFLALALVSVGAVAAITLKVPDFGGALSWVTDIVSLEMIVNTLIIAAGLYFIVPMILKKERTPDSTPGITAMIIIIILFSILLANGIGEKYIWQVDTIKHYIDYFIGDEGVLRGGRIGVLIGSIVILYWFFDFMNVAGEKDGKGKLNFFLALIGAIHLARLGVSICMVIRAGQFVAFVILATNIRKGVASGIEKKWVSIGVSMVLSGFLVLWIGSVLMPEYGGICGGDAAGAEKGILEGGWNIWGLTTSFFTNWWPWLVAGGAIILIWVWGAAKEGAFKRIKGDLGKYIFGRIKTGIRKMRMPGLASLFRLKQWKDQSPENEFPFIFRKLRTELEMHMDFMLRWEVYTAKHWIVRAAEVRIQYELEDKFKQTRDPGAQLRDMYVYKEGCDIVKKANGEYDKKPKNYHYINGWGEAKVQKDNPRSGFNQNEIFIYSIFNNLKEQYENRDLFKDLGDSIGDEKSKLTKEDGDTLKNVSSEMHGQAFFSTKELGGRFGEYKSSLAKYSNWVVAQNLTKVILDQYLLYGEYEHSYLYANPKANWFEAPVKKNGKNGALIVDIARAVPTTNEVGFLIEVEGGKRKDGYLLHEVDERGVCIEDLNAINVDGRSLSNVKVVRDVYEDGKLVKKGIVPYDFLVKNMTWLQQDWFWFVEDVRTGLFHPLSRTASDYADVFAKRKFGSAVPRKASPNRGNPAFDREALKDHGNFKYMGRKEYIGTGENSINKNPGSGPINKYPGISILGFTSYLTNLTRIMEEDQKRVDGFLKSFVYPTGKTDKGVFTGSPEKSSGGGS